MLSLRFATRLLPAHLRDLFRCGKGENRRVEGLYLLSPRVRTTPFRAAIYGPITKASKPRAFTVAICKLLILNGRFLKTVNSYGFGFLLFRRASGEEPNLQRSHAQAKYKVHGAARPSEPAPQTHGPPKDSRTGLRQPGNMELEERWPKRSSAHVDVFGLQYDASIRHSRIANGCRSLEAQCRDSILLTLNEFGEHHE